MVCGVRREDTGKEEHSRMFKTTQKTEKTENTKHNPTGRSRVRTLAIVQYPPFPFASPLRLGPF